MRELFEILNARRRRRGSIDFDLKEPEIVLDDQGMVEDIVAAERNIAHRIIEEFMLVANETVAQHLDDQHTPTLYRVHEEPDPLKVAQFEEFISTLGYSLNRSAEDVKPRDFQKLVERMRGTPEEKPIAFLMLRTMQKARYDPSNLGHFGLAASSYTHFTSPIRRYPDLVVHRTLRESRHGRMAEDRVAELTEDLPEMARHTSERERRADDAERELVQWKKVRFMADKVGDEFDGYITGVSAFGLFIELVEHFVEGMVHISTMADDYYRFVEKAHVLKGENTGKIYRLGDRVRVQVVKVDMERRQIDLGHGRHPRPRARTRNEIAARGAARPSPAARRVRRRRRQAARGASEEGAAPGPQGASREARSDEPAVGGHRHGGAHRSRQERAGPRADRHRSRSAEGGTGPRHHHRPRVRARRGGRRHAVVRRRARARALRQEHARRRRRHRPGDAGHRRGRIGDAADPRALRHLPAAAASRPASSR